MRFEDKYFVKFKFSDQQIQQNFKNALKDSNIAKKDEILEVKFNYAYTALIKAGIALLSFYQIKIKSVPGHHIKIIEKIAEALKDDSIMTMANIMRSKRNLDFYAGGVEVTEKEVKEFLQFSENVLSKIKNIIYSENKAKG